MIRISKCIFEWKKMTPEEYTKYHKDKNTVGIFLGKFLVP